DQPLDLIENNIDVSIRTERSTEIAQLSLVIKKLGSWNRVICASPEYVQRRDPPQQPADLQDHDCLTYQFHQGIPMWYFKKGDQEEAVKIHAHVQSTSGGALRSLALHGQGIAL